ncbi:hypothetical protein [Wolbachia endosymbiont of Ctenocephalides felis wCfeT]|uniref:hypothetical protein n=1 Tax=Wolbachia endosymbiont of Ctenocephalides felis wCfeT TaxID=2732593 RepID=UPI001447F1E2|nr:hypothetical protein [Wolbachia endosymbiont of Ctenocephalides felis wCfeT]
MRSKSFSSDFKAGAKFGIYVYIASIIFGPALLVIAPPLFLPAALLVMNPIACIGLGVVVALISGIGGIIVKPLADPFTDFVNKKIRKPLVNLASSVKNFINEKVRKPLSNLMTKIFSEEEESKGTTALGNTARVASTVLAFSLFGPIGGLVVGALALVDYASKGKLSVAGKNISLGIGSVLKSTLEPYEKKQEIEIDTAKKDLDVKEHSNFKNLNDKVKVQAKELGKEFKEATVSDEATQITNTSKQQGIGC